MAVIRRKINLTSIDLSLIVDRTDLSAYYKSRVRDVMLSGVSGCDVIAKNPLFPCSNFFYKWPTTPNIFENTTLFLLMGLPSTLIRHEKRAFRKRSSNRKNLKMPALSFQDGKHL